MTFSKAFIFTRVIILLIFSAVAIATLQDAKLNPNLGRRVLSLANQRPLQPDSPSNRAGTPLPPSPSGRHIDTAPSPYDGTRVPPSPSGGVPPAG